MLDTTDATAPGAVYGFNLGAGGVIGTALAGSPFATGVSPTGIIIDPTGTLLAVDNNGGSGTITPFSVVTSSGVPTPETAVATGEAPFLVTSLNAP